MTRRCDKFAGKLIHKISYEREQETPDMRGGSIIEWEYQGEIWAFIKPVSWGESMAQARLNSTITHNIHTRFDGDIRTTDRLKYGDRIFQIKAVVNEDERNMWTIIRAVEQVAT